MKQFLISTAVATLSLGCYLVVHGSGAIGSPHVARGSASVTTCKPLDIATQATFEEAFNRKLEAQYFRVWIFSDFLREVILIGDEWRLALVECPRAELGTDIT